MSHQIIKNRDIILFSLQPWNSEIAFNLKDIAYELARYNRVLFVDRAKDRRTVLGWGRGKQVPQAVFPRKIELISENLWVLHPDSVMESVNWLPNYRLFNFFNRINNRRLAVEINHAIEQLSFGNCVFINDNDFFRGLYLRSLLHVRDYIFYIRDFLTAQPYFKKFGPRCEEEMISRADMILANSQWLADYAAQWNPYSSNIGQGCHAEDFMAEGIPEPLDLQSIPRPIVGYFGAVTEMRLDEALMLRLSLAMPDISLVFVGPSDDQFQKSKLRSQKNVYFLGLRTPDLSAAYISHFTICINPQKRNQLTLGNYPRKIDEYLAAGKPVVATRTPAMEMFREYVFLCDTMEEFVEQIRELLNKPGSLNGEMASRRRLFALTHSWENVIVALSDAYFRMKRK